jgi:hypothetical protein
VEVTAGADEIRMTLGPWDVLAERALSAPEGTYRCDFTAVPLSPVVRVLRITKMDYDRARVAVLSAVAAGHSGADEEAPHRPREATVDGWLSARGTNLPPSPFSTLANAVLPPPPHRSRSAASGDPRARAVVGADAAAAAEPAPGVAVGGGGGAAGWHAAAAGTRPVPAGSMASPLARADSTTVAVAGGMGDWSPLPAAGSSVAPGTADGSEWR